MLKNNRKKLFNIITWVCVVLSLIGIFVGIVGCITLSNTMAFSGLFLIGVSVSAWFLSYPILRCLPHLPYKTIFLKNISSITKVVIVVGLVIMILGSVLVVENEMEREKKVTELRREIYVQRSSILVLEGKNPDNLTYDERISYICYMLNVTALEYEIDHSFKPVFDAVKILIAGNLITNLGIVAYIFRGRKNPFG
ncbi:MAG: hypothetical protein L6265_10065 [Thermoplasmatales archaeon]|nr:hypothetical protein [Patescibacteria group bacterium]MCG2826922.1 hypothetical protein [Thermoplasmatales archaeon]